VTDAYLSQMVRLACELAGGDGASLFWVDGQVLRPYIIYNLPKEYVEGIDEVRVGEQCCGRAVAHKQPWIVSDMLSDPLFADGRKGALDAPIRAAFSVPVLDGGKAIASLACHYASPHTPSKLDIERNEVFARLIAMTLHGRKLVSASEPILTFALHEKGNRNRVLHIGDELEKVSALREDLDKLKPAIDKRKSYAESREAPPAKVSDPA
jgi:hypothetical protein